MAIQNDTQQDTRPEAARYRGDYQSTQTTYVAEAISPMLLSRVSWGAVTAGAALALAVQLVLNLFGMGVGFAAYVSPKNADAALAVAKAMGYDAWLAGRVKKDGGRKTVLVPSMELVFEGDTLQVR